MLARRILVVEDSLDQAEHIRRLLEAEGYQAEVANNGQKALERVHSTPFDLILSDVVMSDMDGYALCQALKSEPQTKWLPFVFLTERKAALDIIKGLAHGADNFIPKPFEDDYLVQRIRRIFEHLELRSQGYRDTEVTLQVDGREVVITPDRQQIVELLLATSEELHQVNARLDAYNKNLEAEVEIRTEQLRQAEVKYRMLVEQLPAVTYIAAANAAGQMHYVSPQIEPLLGFSPAEWLSRPELWAEQLHSADRQRALAEYAHSVANRTGFSTEYRLLRRDGREVWVRSEGTVILDEAGRPQWVQGIMIDVTERKRAEEELQRQREALLRAEKVTTMSQILAGVAHELNNPLAVITSYTELLREMTLGGPLGDRVEKLYRSVQRCARIVKNFFALARQHPTERQKVQINDIIRETLELLTYSLRVDDVEVRMDLEEQLPPLWADPHQLHQLVVNLVSNAHRALQEAPRARRLTVSTAYDPSQSRVVVAVADTGPGIPPELKTRVFEPFFTTKPAGQGTGLGLTLCQGIVEGHGGTIRLESSPGEGALFIIELPVSTAAVVAPEASASTTPESLQGRTILVVDDEPDVLEVLAEVLTLESYEVDTAANGIVALRKVEERTYDLILSDLRMPELDGPGFYHELERRHPALCRRMVFLTGDTLSPETQAFLAGAAVPTLSKPFSLADIRHITQQMLQAGNT